MGRAEMKDTLVKATEAACVARAQMNEIFDNRPCSSPCKWCVAATVSAIESFVQNLPVGLPTADSPSPFRLLNDEAKETWLSEVRRAATELLPPEDPAAMAEEQEWVDLLRSEPGAAQ